MRRLRWFADAVKVYGSAGNKKSLEQLLGLKSGRGKPVVQERRDRILKELLDIDLLLAPRGPTGKAQRGQPAPPSWKVVGRARGKTRQGVKRLYERWSPNLPEALAKEIVARLKRKPPPIGMAKSHSAARGKEIAAYIRRKR